MLMSNDSQLNLTDIYLSAFLVSQGAQLETTKRDPDGRIHFFLRGMEKMDELQRAYWSNTPVAVVPAQLFASLKYLKGLIHSRP